MEERARKRSVVLHTIPTTTEMAEMRFGKSEGLATVHKNRIELARYFADSWGLDFDDPDVQVICIAKAVVRHKEILLLKQIERDLEERSRARGVDYEECLFDVALRGSHERVHRELDRLHSKAKGYERELNSIAQRKATDD